MILKVPQEIPDGNYDILYVETVFNAFNTMPLREWGIVENIQASKEKDYCKIDLNISKDTKESVMSLISTFMRFESYRIVLSLKEDQNVYTFEHDLRKG